MRKLFLAGNWKLNKTAAETKSFFSEFLPAVAAVDNVEVALCPSFLSLAAAQQAVAGSKVRVGAQNISYAANGAYTGEISAEMLKEQGIALAIIGHSERRQYFGETDETVNQRTKAALAAGIQPITCIGETLEERESGQMEAVLERQLVEGLKELSSQEMEKTVIAYEPVWAIGTGVTASPQQAQDAHAFIRSILAREFGQEVADKVIIQYGGSVKPANVAELVSCADIDGALVGGASLKPEDFAALVTTASAQV